MKNTCFYANIISQAFQALDLKAKQSWIQPYCTAHGHYGMHKLGLTCKAGGHGLLLEEQDGKIIVVGSQDNSVNTRLRADTEIRTRLSFQGAGPTRESAELCSAAKGIEIEALQIEIEP